MGVGIRVKRPRPVRADKPVHSTCTKARLVKASEIRVRAQSPSPALTVRPKAPRHIPTTKDMVRGILDSLFPDPPPAQADAKEA
jgi:hypothetical protein